MANLIDKLGKTLYLELMATGTPAVAFTGALTLMSGQRSAWVLAPRLAAIPALNPETLLVCPPSIKEAYWASEQALKSGAVDAVALVLDAPYDLTQSRRFKLATEAHGTRLIVILPGTLGAFNSAAQKRWHLIPKVNSRGHEPLTRWQQLKNKRGPLMEMEVEGHAHSLSVV